ncbi:Gfo/Idh/MocA family protein [Microbacterium sp. NPDC055903]
MPLPPPRLIAADAVPVLRWGVIGTGGIANRFARAVHRRTPQRIVAVTARDAARTAAFAAEHGIARTTASAEQLVADPGIDVVYIATPHSSHHRLALLAISEGKHVLVEKPLATSSHEAREIMAAASAAGVLAMEAMWTLYLPQSDVIRRLLADGHIGEVHQVSADFGSVVAYDPSNRMWDPALAGGALLDLGVYPIAFAASVLGQPTRVQASGVTTADGIDLRSVALLSHAGGAEAVVSCSMVSESPVGARIIGAHGRIDVVEPFFAPTGLVIRRGGEVEEWRDTAFDERYDALSYQATALAGYIGEGRRESPLQPLAAVAAELEVVERIRAQLTVVDDLP